MKIIVVGCGKIGTAVIESLVAEGHDVTAMDNRPEALNAVVNVYDVMGVQGSATDRDALLEAGSADADLAVCVTGSDEINMLGCFLAQRLGAAHTIARIRNPEYNEKTISFMKQQLNLSLVINPEQFVAQEIFNTLRLQAAVNVETFSGRNLELIELILTPEVRLDGCTLMDIKRRYNGAYLICAVKRGDQVFIPGGSFVLHNGDQIGLAVSPQESHRILGLFGFGRKKAKNIIVLGATRTAFYLSKLLLEAGNSVKVIDKDIDWCQTLSRELPGCKVVHGAGTEQDLLAEEGIDSADAFVALTGIDEENILMSLYAGTRSVPKVVTKVNRNELSHLAAGIGITSMVSPKKIVSDIVTRYARALENSKGSNVETLYKLMDSSIEALEFNVKSDFAAVNIPIRNMKLKKDILIAGIIRNRKLIVPTGDDMIMTDDRVVVIVSGQQFVDLSDILL